MALKPVDPDRPRTVGEVPRDALARVDFRVKQVIARQAAVLQARRAAERLKAVLDLSGRVPRHRR